MTLVGVGQSSAQGTQDWKILMSGDTTQHPVTPGPGYTLRNLSIGRAVKYGERKYGINLVWGSNGHVGNIRLHRAALSSDPIKYGEAIAIRVDGGDYLRYGSREYGINLVWSKTPVYEWELRGSEAGSTGGQAKSQVRLGLYNKTHQDHVVYCERDYGINLRWAKDVKQSSTQADTASVQLSLREGPFPQVSTSGKATDHIKWVLTPVQLTGSSGMSTSVTREGDYTAFERNVAPGKWYCFYEDQVAGLRPGKWRIRASDPLWSAEGQVTLSSGTNRVHFSKHKSGCVQGIGYPGD